tara:strand:+ start:895 stop:1800 length:906 start_codon:yes stop_codon:yes gene_type:complete
MYSNKLTALDSVLRSVGIDIVKSIFANEVIRDNGNELRIRPSGAFCYNKETTQWYDHALSEGGNIITLVAKHNNISNAQAIDYLSNTFNIDPQIIKAREVKRETLDETIQERIDVAKNIWAKSVPLIDTHAELYLNKRCIESHIIPDTFRSWEGNLVAPIYLVRDNVIYTTGIQVTYLNKFAEKINKRTYGLLKNGAVHLTGYEHLTDTLCIGEGLEDCLTFSQFNEGASVWATLGTGGLSSIELPEDISEVILIRDNDKASKDSTDKFKEVYADKYNIYDEFAPEGCKDWNEYHQKRGNK